MGIPLKSPNVSYTKNTYNVGVDETVEFEFKKPLSGRLSASITTDLPRQAKLIGNDVEILINDKWWNPQHIEITWQGTRFEIKQPIVGGGFQFEAAHVSELILNRKLASEVIRGDNSRSVIKIMENSLKRANFEYLVK